MVFKTHVWARGMCPKSLCRPKNGFYPVIGISPCCRTNVQNPVRKLRHVPVWYRIRFMRSFAMCRLLLGRFIALKSSLHWPNVKRTKAG